VPNHLLLEHDTELLSAPGMRPLQGAPQQAFWNSQPSESTPARVERHGQICGDHEGWQNLQKHGQLGWVPFSGGPQMTDMYWTLICKSCGERHLLSYRGDLPPEETVSVGMSPIQGFQCDTCGALDDYSPEDLIFLSQGLDRDR
jgi:hypothetical protein